MSGDAHAAEQEPPKTTLKNCNCWVCVEKRPFEGQNHWPALKFFISRNLYFQQKSDKDIRILTDNIQKMKPNLKFLKI